MKRSSYVLSAAAIFALASCQQAEIAVPEAAEESTFSIIPSFPETRTSLDGETFQVEWDADDVIYAVTTDEAWGLPFVSNEETNIESIAEFVNDGTGKFSTTSSIAAGSHTFNFLYTGGTQKSYHRGAGSTYSLSATQTQTGTSTDHIKTLDALAGTLTATAPLSGDASVTMSHIFSLMKVNVTNNSGKTITPSSMAITFEGATVAGVFPVDFENGAAGEATKSQSSTITVKFKELTIANGASVPVYFVIAPLSNYSGKVTFALTDSDSKVYEKSSTLSKVSFEAGKYNTASVSFSQGVGVTSISVADALTKIGDGKNYQLTGVCQNIKSTTYGNFDLVDATGSIYIYGLLTADGQAKQFASLDIEEGDTVTLTGTVVDYNGTAEIKNATFVSRVKGEKVKTFELANTTPSTSVGAAATSASFTVKSTAKWSTSCTSGMSADPSSFAGSDTETSTKVTLTFPANTSTSAKTYVCTISTTDNVSGEKTLTFTVNQAAAENISGSSTLDKLTHGAIGVEGTTYTEWTKTGASGAVYAGNTAGGKNNDVIQMRSSNSNSGIVVTSATKYVKSVTIKWASATDDYVNGNKVVDVYGNMNAFTSPAELYNIANTVAKVGSSAYNDGLTQTITFDKNYHYVGIRSNNGALYLEEIDIEWSTSKVGEDPAASLPKLSKPVLTSANITETSFDVNWTAVANAVNYSVRLDGENYEETTGTSVSFSGLTAGTTHTVSVVAVGDKTNYDNSTAGTITVTTADNSTSTSVFDFSKPSSLGITAPAAGAGTELGSKTIKVGDITLSTTDGGTATRVWNSDGVYDLRVYKSGGTISLKAATGKTISKIVLAGNATGVFTVSTGEFKSGVWEGSASTVTFTATGTAKVSTITVFYK